MKNKKHFITLIFVAIVIFEVYSQVEITKSSTSYYYDNTKTDLCFYVIKNTSDSIVFLWFDEKKDNGIPLSLRVHHYIFNARGKDFSFFTMVRELKAGTAIALNDVLPNVNHTFIKKLEPKLSFTVIIKDSLTSGFSENFIEVVPYCVFEKINKSVGLNWYEGFEYKEDFIVF